MDLSDIELIRQAQKGHAAAFHQLIDRHAEPLFRLATSLLPSRADAEDVVQETLTAAFRSLRSFQERSSVKTWLFAICYRQAALFRRKQRAPIRMLGEDEVIADPATVQPSGGASGMGGGSHVATTDLRIDMEAALASLPESQRAILLLREFDGLSYDEIAEVLQIPRGTVESRIFRARQSLKEYLLAHGHDPQ